MYKDMTIITKFISLIQLTPSSKTILTKKDLLTVNKRFLPSDKIVTIAQKVGPQPQTISIIYGSRNLLIPGINSRTHLSLYQPRTTTVLSAPLLFNLRVSSNNNVISNPNIKFTSLLENIRIDILFEEARTNLTVKKYVEILDDIKLKTFLKIYFSEEDLGNIFNELQKIELSLERKQEILYNLQKYFKSNPPTVEIAELFLKIWRGNDCEFTALDFNPQNQSNLHAREDKKRNKSKDINKNKKLEEEQKTIISNMFTICKKMEEDIIKFEKEPTKNLSSNLIQEWYNYLINRSNALPLQREEFDLNNKLLLLGKTSGATQEDVLEKINNNNNVKNKESLKDKQDKTQAKILVMSNLMNKLFLDFKNEPQKIIKSPLLQLWFDYLNNRGCDLPLQPNEISINDELKTLWDISVPKQEDVLTKLKDNLKILKENSTLPPRITLDIVDCFTLTHYNKEIKRITDIIELLQTKALISENDIKLLAINSFAAIIDAEGTFKLTQETYQSFKENKDSLAFSYTKDKPDMNYILTQIKEKNYFIIHEYKNKPGSLIDIAYLGHKTLVINDTNTRKKIRIGLLTSTDDKNTFLLDNYQKTNPDINKQEKKQYFRILSPFIIVEENEPLLIDMETTLLLQGKNSDNEDITVILQTNYENKKNLWSDNNYQISYNADGDFLRKITIIFYKKQLEMLEEHLQSLEKNIKGLTEEEVNAKIQQLKDANIKIINDKKFQQYLSLLSPEHQELYKVLTIFEKKQQQENFQKKQKEIKQNMNKIAQDFKNAQEQEKQNKEGKPLTAKEKKDIYLAEKNKKLENISNEKTL